MRHDMTLGVTFQSRASYMPMLKNERKTKILI
jgi:hypothetical protein